MIALRTRMEPDPGGAPQAVRRAVACTTSQLALSASLIAAAVLAGLALRAYTWVALFVALLLPLCLTAAALLLIQRTWLALWVCMLVLSPADAVTAGCLYEAGLSWGGIDVRNAGHVMAAEAVLGALLLVLPLWMAQQHARALYVAQLSQAALASDLKALQAQIEPHFLYNTLANTRYLVRHQPERAVEMLDHLIAYLRSALPDLRSPMSTLGRECELAAHYLELMTIRYGDRLDVRIDCAIDASDFALPPLMLMPLVENAVQHGVEPHLGPVTVSISVRRQRDCVRIAVRDNGAGVGDAVLGSGVGLRNVRQRLQALYGGAASLHLSVDADGWTAAELTLPVPA